MCLFFELKNHERSLDGVGEVFGGIVVESDLEAMELCYRPELWDAEFLVCLSKHEEIVARCHLHRDYEFPKRLERSWSASTGFRNAKFNA